MTTTATRTESTTEATAKTGAKSTEFVLSATRIVVGFLFVCHATQGLWGTFGGVDGAGGAVPLGSWPGWWGSLFELIGGALVLAGLFTRVAAVLCSGVMAYAYFTVHAPMGLFPLQNMGEQSVLFCWIFLLFAFVGPGRWALDSLRRSA
ncbi:DoxX family protein [Amycolatopsis sp. H20-H5]|uniref:DoxX family protein n=1 Tax=Amycolatopsis sp. H20-H5 TaxID=3046309 RepID=UPI002DB75F76|nr:DoxX family protein [Amycolatopsis sp. H20-H5]MEC3978376.1 DoxX family protein [Amycolatopsis sp. H20-H5]